MHIDITGHHVEITDALKSYVENKMDRIAKHSNHVHRVEVILTVEKNEQKAEATLVMDGAELFAQDCANDLYVAVDALIDKLDRQLVKHKEKRLNH